MKPGSITADFCTNALSQQQSADQSYPHAITNKKIHGFGRFTPILIPFMILIRYVKHKVKKIVIHTLFWLF
jgi:hypothetical protein